MGKKNIFVLVAVAVAALILIAIAVVMLKPQPVAPNKSAASNGLDNSGEAVIPTVTSETKVMLTAVNNRHSVQLDIKGIPNQTQTIEYSLSYHTKQQGLQGIIGTITLENNATDYQLKRDLGTCSSGTCIYHDVVGKITVELKFNGNYGQKLFSQDYEL